MARYPLKWRDYLILVFLFVLLYFFTITQQYYIPESIRPFSLLFVVLLCLTSFFFYLKPENPYRLSRFLSLWLGIIVLFIIILKHIIISFDISYKSAIILTITLVSPFISGYIIKKIKPTK